jgi:glucose/arabinose dehydrogenase
LMPNGVAIKGNDLYVAEVYRVRKYSDIESHLDHPPKPVVINDSFPHDLHHGWKYIKFGPDGMMYVPIGAPCNVCMKDDSRYAGMMRMKPDGTGLEQFANGIRNTVGYDWDPKTKELWFTDNGRDWLGDNLPPDELNHAPVKGMHFGFPFRYGQNVSDPQYGAKAPSGLQFTPAAQDLDAHVAALGMVFYTGKMFPPEYQNQILICEHGSWNRTPLSGYRVTMVTLKDGKPVKYQPFIDGWLSDVGISGRPVDLLVMPDGSLLISDDKGGAIYRVTYSKP